MCARNDSLLGVCFQTMITIGWDGKPQNKQTNRSQKGDDTTKSSSFMLIEYFSKEIGINHHIYLAEFPTHLVILLLNI